MRQNIIIQQEQFNDVPGIDLRTAGGGMARFYDRSGPVDWMGIEAEFVQNVYNKQYALSETGYPDWTPSTTAGAIVASTNLTAYTADMATYEYLIKWRFECDVAWNSGVTQKAIPMRTLQEHLQVIAKRPSSYANIEAGEFDGNACLTGFTAPWMRYYNSSGQLTYTWGASYGFYSAAVAATFSNATSDTPKITIKTPTVSARCSTTYFATSRAASVDQANSKLRLVGDLYRVKKGTFVRAMYGDVVNLFNHSIIS